MIHLAVVVAIAVIVTVRCWAASDLVDRILVEEVAPR